MRPQEARKLADECITMMQGTRDPAIKDMLGKLRDAWIEYADWLSEKERASAYSPPRQSSRSH